MKVFSIVTLLLIVGCGSSPKKNIAKDLTEYKGYDTLGNLLFAGYYDSDTLPNGRWSYFSKGHDVASGQFEDGLMFRRWSYSYSNFQGVIDWDTATVLDGIRINYPNDFIVENRGNWFRASSPDSVFEILFTLTTSISIKDYMESIEGSINAIGNRVTKKACHEIVCENSKAYLLFYDFSSPKDEKLNYTLLVTASQHSPFIVTLKSERLDRDQFQYIMTVFTGITNNMYVDKKRILDPNKIEEYQCL